jgi:hypothetical protein
VTFDYDAKPRYEWKSSAATRIHCQVDSRSKTCLNRVCCCNKERKREREREVESPLFFLVMDDGDDGDEEELSSPPQTVLFILSRE